MTAQLTAPPLRSNLSPHPELPHSDKPHRLKFSVEQFHLMYERHIFAESDRYELINGEIIAMSPIGLKHAVVDSLIVKHQNIEEPDEVKISRPVLKTSGRGDSSTEFN